MEMVRYAELEVGLLEANEDAARIARKLDDDKGVLTLFSHMVLERVHNQVVHCHELEKALWMQKERNHEEAKRVKRVERLVSRAEDALAQQWAAQELKDILELRVHKVSSP
jgi:hypothetical protein